MKPKLKTEKAQKPAPAASSPTADEVIVSLPTDKVLISALNTRQPTAAEVKAAGLVDSIGSPLGQTSPCIVRPHPEKKGYYELAAGARRTTACAVLGIPVKCIVREIPNEEFEDLIFTDNEQREDPDPLAEAALVARRLAAGASVKELAARYGKTALWVQRRAKLANLCPELVKLWKKPHPGGLLHFDVEMMEHLALFDHPTQKAYSTDWNITRSGNLKRLKEVTEANTCKLNVPWLNDEATFIKGCGPGCASDSAKETSLFGFTDKKTECSRCLNPACFKVRAGLAADEAANQLIEKQGLAADCFKAAYTTNHNPGAAVVSLKNGEDATVLNIVREWEINSYQIIKLKAKEKPKPGALLALDVTQPLKPVVVVLKLKPGSKAAKAASVSKAKAKADPAELQTAKIATFQGRRWSRTRDKLKEALDLAPHPNIGPRKQVALAAWFGTQQHHEYIDHYQKPEDHGEWEFEPRVSWSTAKCDSYYADQWDKLWIQIRPVISLRLHHIQKVEDFTKPHILRELREVADLIGFDLDEAKRQIDLHDLPVPKSWGRGLDPHTCLPPTTPEADDDE